MPYLLELLHIFFNKPFDFYIWVLACLHHKLHCKKHREEHSRKKQSRKKHSRKSEKAFLVLILLVKTICTKFFLLGWAHCPLSSIFLHVFFLSSQLLLDSSHAHAHIHSDSQEKMSWLLKIWLISVHQTVLSIKPYCTSVLSWRVLQKY